MIPTVKVTPTLPDCEEPTADFEILFDNELANSLRSKKKKALPTYADKALYK